MLTALFDGIGLVAFCVVGLFLLLKGCAVVIGEGDVPPPGSGTVGSDRVGITATIDGKLYDTATMELIYKDPRNTGYKPYWGNLYRTQTGQFVMEKVGYFKGSTDTLEVLNDFEAKRWVQKHTNDEIYQRIFGVGVVV